jgi:hypothetical protein
VVVPLASKESAVLLYSIQVKHLNVHYASLHDGHKMELRWKMRFSQNTAQTSTLEAAPAAPSLSKAALVFSSRAQTRTGWYVHHRASSSAEETKLLDSGHVAVGTCQSSPLTMVSPLSASAGGGEWTVCSAVIDSVPTTGFIEIWVSCDRPVRSSSSSSKKSGSAINRVHMMQSLCSFTAAEANDLTVRNIPPNVIASFGGDSDTGSWSSQLQELVSAGNNVTFVASRSLLSAIPIGHKILRSLVWHHVSTQRPREDTEAVPNKENSPGTSNSVSWKCKLFGGSGSNTSSVSAGTLGFQWSVSVSRDCDDHANAEFVAAGTSADGDIAEQSNAHDKSSRTRDPYQWQFVNVKLDVSLSHGDRIHVTGMPSMLSITSEGIGVRPLAESSSLNCKLLISDCEIQCTESGAPVSVDVNLPGTVMNCPIVLWQY